MADKDRAYLDSLTHAYFAVEIRHKEDYWGPSFPMIKMTIPEQPSRAYSMDEYISKYSTKNGPAIVGGVTIEEPREFHACEGANRDISCEEMKNGELWFVGTDNESYYVNYCPFCGFKARKQWPYKGASK
jgi:hypothetical protein